MIPGHLAAAVAAIAAPTLGGCALLPQDATEWTIALVISGVLLVGVIVLAIWASKRHDQ